MKALRIIALWVLIWTLNARDASADAYCDYVNNRDCTVYPNIAVCGTNGVTYASDRYLAKAFCTDKTIHKASNSPCHSTASSTKAATTTTSTSTTTTTTSTTTTPFVAYLCNDILAKQCDGNIEPVCGTNNAWYINTCEFQKARCIDSTIGLNHFGQCADALFG